MSTAYIFVKRVVGEIHLSHIMGNGDELFARVFPKGTRRPNELSTFSHGKEYGCETIVASPKAMWQIFNSHVRASKSCMEVNERGQRRRRVVARRQFKAFLKGAAA
jgi:hypothetical protein